MKARVILNKSKRSKMVRIAIGFVFIMVLTAHQSAGQNACELTLTKAQEEFDAGRFDAVPSLLEECLKKNQNRGWEQRAHLLLAETYLLLENAAMADESYLKVIQANPEFETDETRDPIDLVYLSKRFTATPIFSLQGRLGLNTSFIRVIHDIQTPGNPSANAEYSYKMGWQAGSGIDYHYNENWSAGAELNYTFTSFGYQSKNIFEETTLELTDQQTWLSVPLIIKYSKSENEFRPYLFLGYSFNLLLSVKSNIIIDGDNESPVYNYRDNRNNFTQAVIAGAGLKYKWGLRYFFGEVRYSMGLRNMADPDNRNWPIDKSFLYVDDDFRMDNVFLSVGYIHPFYKARKLKRARTKSVLRTLKRNDTNN